MACYHGTCGAGVQQGSDDAAMKDAAMRRKMVGVRQVELDPFRIPALDADPDVLIESNAVLPVLPKPISAKLLLFVSQRHATRLYR